jgi:hypothetical protein
LDSTTHAYRTFVPAAAWFLAARASDVVGGYNPYVLRAASCCLALALLTLAEPGGAGDPRPLSCVRYRTEARPWGVGFKHVVVLMSECTVEAECTVSTDVNPEPTVVAVPPKETREVVTYLSSPARAFVASVVCRSN